MKSTSNCGKNCKTNSAKKSKAASGCQDKNCKSSKTSEQEDEDDPQGSYTGNPIGLGKYELPVQDVDDL